jgi:hypothetical protein
VTVPVAFSPPITLVGATETLFKSGVTVSVVKTVVVPLTAVIFTGVLVLTKFVVILNVAVVAPALTRTGDVTITAEPLLLVTVTYNPPVGAAALSVIVPVDDTPPTTLVGATVIDSRSGNTVRVAVWVAPPYTAEMTTGVGAETVLVVIVTIADVVPAGMVTGVVTAATAGLELLSAIGAPPVGAGPASVRVPVDDTVPNTVGGTRVTEASGGVTLNVAVDVTPPYVAVIVTGVVVGTLYVVIVKVWVVEPLGTVTGLTTVAAAGVSLVTLTAAPPIGAGPVRVIVPVAVSPPIRLGAETETPDNVGVIVKGTLSVTLPNVADRLTVVLAVTIALVILNVAVVEPVGMVTVTGTAARRALAVVRLTISPLLPACPEMVTVPVDVWPPTCGFGAAVNDVNTAA